MSDQEKNTSVSKQPKEIDDPIWRLRVQRECQMRSGQDAGGRLLYHVSEGKALRVTETKETSQK